MSISVEVGNASRPAPVVGEDLLDHGLSAQVAVSCRQRHRDHRILRAVLGIHFASESATPPAAHTWAAAVVGHAVARHGKVKWVQSQPFGGRPQNFEFALDPSKGIPIPPSTSGHSGVMAVSGNSPVTDTTIYLETGGPYEPYDLGAD